MKLDRNGKAAIKLKLLAIDKENISTIAKNNGRTMQGQIEYMVKQLIKEDSNVKTN